MFGYIGKTISVALLSVPMMAGAQNMPIEMVASNQKSAPSMGGRYGIIGYWDVDDSRGNSSSSGFASSTLGAAYSGLGTHQMMPDPNVSAIGGYMASLGVNPSELHKVSALTLHASNTSVTAVRKQLTTGLHQQGVVFRYGENVEYIVGVWDVDGGGGYGNDGSKGSYAMTLAATLGQNASARKLVDLFMIASENKSPTLKTGYELVGYWDVDGGGSRGTDGSKGRYMMTLLAKWE